MAGIQRKGARKFKTTKVTAGDNDPAPHLRGATIQAIRDRHYLIATDRYVAARWPIDGADVSTGYVPRLALPFIDRGDEITLSEDQVHIGKALSRKVNGEWRDGEPLIQLARIEPRNSSDREERYPDLGEIWPEEPEGESVRIHLDTRLLRRLAEGLACDRVTLEIDLSKVKVRKTPERRPIAHCDTPIVVWKYGTDRTSTSVEGLLNPPGGTLVEMD